MANTGGIECRLAAYLGAPLEHFRVLDSGWETTIFAFMLGARSARSAAIPAGTPLVLRFYEGSRAQDKSVREVATLERLASERYPVP
ncbi:MAG: hypothetical protein ABSG46_06020, partial [Candidatus Binataceae bacterium]